MRKFRKVVVHTFDHNHGLLVLKYCQSLILHSLRGDIHLGQLTYLQQERVIGRSGLSLYRDDLQLRIEIGEKRSHQIMEAIEDTQHDDQSHGSHRHPYHRNGTDDIDDVRTLLGEEVSASDKERKIHLTFYLYTLLLFQEFINALKIVKAIVQEETKFRDDTQLISHFLAQVIANGLLAGIDILQNLLTSL